MRELLQDYYNGNLSRRRFLRRLVETGLTATAARSVVESADAAETQTAENGARYKVITGTGGELLAEQARAAGVKYIFTNPGSFEVGFFDALTDRPDLQVIVGLHEGIVVPMADGYHKATGEPAFINVHAIAGTAQMAGQLYNAHRDGSAIVVTAGMQDATNYSDDVLLAPRPGFSQTDINRQFTKVSWEVRNGASIPVFTRRAFKTAMTAPGGPVYIAFSSFSLEMPNLKGEIWPKENFLIQTRPRPAKDQVEQLAKMLIEAKSPAAIFGDEVWKSKGQTEAVELCEMLGLPAATGTQTQQAFPNFPTRHPQYIGQFVPDRAYPAGQADVVTTSADIDKLKDESYVARETMAVQTQAIHQLVKLSDQQRIENERIWKTLFNHKESIDHTFDMIGQLTQQVDHTFGLIGQLTQQVDRLAATLDRHIRSSFNGNQ